MSKFHCFLFMSLLSLASSCYRMPSDDECSVIPTTNNPTVTGNHEGGGTPLPGMSY